LQSPALEDKTEPEVTFIIQLERKGENNYDYRIVREEDSGNYCSVAVVVFGISHRKA
jgi:hypothetical protein